MEKTEIHIFIKILEALNHIRGDTFEELTNYITFSHAK